MLLRMRATGSLWGVAVGVARVGAGAVGVGKSSAGTSLEAVVVAVGKSTADGLGAAFVAETAAVADRGAVGARLACATVASGVAMSVAAVVACARGAVVADKTTPEAISSGVAVAGSSVVCDVVAGAGTAVTNVPGVGENESGTCAHAVTISAQKPNTKPALPLARWSRLRML
jgi:hypothetical protein